MPGEDRRFGIQRLRKLVRQPRLSNSGRTEHREQVRGRFVHRPLERLPELDELPFTANHCGLEPAGNRRRAGNQLEETPALRLCRLEARRCANELRGPFADDDLPGRSSLREACGFGDDLAGDCPAGGPVAGHDGSRADARADGSAYVRVVERSAQLRAGAYRAQRVVLVHLRHAEHGHDPVAQDLLHRAAVPDEYVRERCDRA